MKAYDINWDTDGKDFELPMEMKIPEGLKGDEITEYLSNETWFCIFDYKIGEFSPSDIENVITDYVNTLLYQHDMSVSGSDRNQKIAEKIINRCVNDIIPKLDEFTLDMQIRYFVRQTMLYMIGGVK